MTFSIWLHPDAEAEINEAAAFLNLESPGLGAVFLNDLEHQIILDGKKFEWCEFNGTEIIYEGRSEFGLRSCNLKGFKFSLAKYAAKTLIMLTNMYQDPAFRPLIEEIIQSIKAGRLPESTPISPMI